jgi:hypothetical protein
MIDQLRTWNKVKMLKNIAGWAMIAAAVGILLEIVIPHPAGEGTIGLIPLYLGFPIGSLGLVPIIWKRDGWFPAIMAACGLAGILYFMVVYPLGIRGWAGGFFLSIGFLFLPMPYRFAALAWLAIPFLELPILNARNSGLFDGFVMFGIGTALSGMYMLIDPEKDHIEN